MELYGELNVSYKSLVVAITDISFLNWFHLSLELTFSLGSIWKCLIILFAAFFTHSALHIHSFCDKVHTHSSFSLCFSTLLYHDPTHSGNKTISLLLIQLALEVMKRDRRKLWGITSLSETKHIPEKNAYTIDLFSERKTII